MVTVCVAALGSTGAPQSCRNWSDDTETVRASSRELEHAATETSTIDQHIHAIANRIRPPRTGPTRFGHRTSPSAQRSTMHITDEHGSRASPILPADAIDRSA